VQNIVKKTLIGSMYICTHNIMMNKFCIGYIILILKILFF
jgi:hypothetical protein